NNAADTPSGSAGRSRAFTTPLSRYPIGDAIDRDFFPFVCGPYYAEYLEDGIIVGSYEISREREMVRIEALSDERLAKKMSFLHCLMMSHGGGLLARYRALLKSHDDHLQSSNARLKTLLQELTSLCGLTSQIVATQTYPGDIYALTKGYKHSLAEKDAEILRLKAFPSGFTFFFRGGFQSLVWKFLASDEFSRVYGELFSLIASVGFERGLNMDHTQEQLIDDYSTRPLSALLELEPDRLARPAAVPAPKVVGGSPPSLKELTVTLASFLVELFPKDGPPSSAAAATEQPSQERNEEWLNAMIDTTDEEMVDVASGKPVERTLSYATRPKSNGFAVGTIV
nr:hypothetical protein [Tanacetum cinerariifolium]